MPRCPLKAALLTMTVISVAMFAPTRSKAADERCSEFHTHVSVFNQQGSVIAGLAANNFIAQVNGKAARVSAAERDLGHHRIAVLVDHSGSMLDLRWEVAREVVLSLITRAPSPVPIEVLRFDDKPQKIAAFDQRRAAVVAATVQMFSSDPPKGRTRLYDGLHVALATLQPLQPGDLMFVVTDGNDNESGEDAGKLRRELLHSRVRLFGLLLSSDSGPPMGSVQMNGIQLQQLVRDTGGTLSTIIAPESPQLRRTLQQRDIDHVRARSSWLLRSMIDGYGLTLVPSEQVSRSAKLKIAVTVPELKDGKFTAIAPVSIESDCP